MSVVMYIFAALNILFGVVSVVPCIMGGVMGMGSPQAQNDPLAITFAILFLTFPIVCLICGILPPVLNYFQMPWVGLFFGLLPYIEAASVIGFMWINEGK